MKYRRLGQSDLHVSVIGIGTWQLGGEWGQTYSAEEVKAILEQASQCGINLRDTAECYGDHLSEELLGRAMAGHRDQWIVATKFGHHFNKPFDRDLRFDPSQVQQQLEASLRALQTEYIDLYQFHSGDDDIFETEGLWEMLERQKEAGKIRHLGISISSKLKDTFQVDKAAALGASAIQLVHNRLNPQSEAVFDSCIKQDLGILARVPLACGFLSGKYPQGTRFADDDVRQVWLTEELRNEQLAQVQTLHNEVPTDASMAQWALAWCLQHPAVTCVIPGCRGAEQVMANALAADLAMVRTDHPQAMASGETT